MKQSVKISRDVGTAWLIKAAGTWVENMMKQDLEPFRLSPRQFAIMMILADRNGLTQVEIGRTISMPGDAISRNLDTLERRELVKRYPHESSKRSNRIYITRSGQELVTPLSAIASNLHRQLLEVLDEQEERTLFFLLSKLVQSDLSERGRLEERNSIEYKKIRNKNRLES